MGDNWYQTARGYFHIQLVTVRVGFMNQVRGITSIALSCVKTILSLNFDKTNTGIKIQINQHKINSQIVS